MEKAKGKKLFYRPAGKRKGMYTPTQIICVSFVIVIALGTFLLSLPVASKHGRLDVLDAMFTATSATCVTGLIVRDTWTQFTYFGQAVILLLIQVGGLGFMAFATLIMVALGSLSALGYGPLAGVTVFGMQFLDFFDFLTNSVMMPIAAIATCLLVSRVIGVEQIAQEVEQDGQRFRRKPVFNFMIRWLCPIFAAIILASSVANAFGWIAM